MTDKQTAVQVQSDSNESLGEILRTRALASSTQLLVGQAIGGVALNAAVLVWHPERWGIATAAAATIALQALWSIAVQRTTADSEPHGRSDGEQALPGHEDGRSDGNYDAEFTAATRYELANGLTPRELRRWWHVRRAAAVGASAAALTLLWFVCMMLLGRLMT